jgi:hypothetical protein
LDRLLAIAKRPNVAVKASALWGSDALDLFDALRLHSLTGTPGSLLKPLI